nr:hypothetical protein Iba_scaffold16146CG0390 [Ipomoea batatas]
MIGGGGGWFCSFLSPSAAGELPSSTLSGGFSSASASVFSSGGGGAASLPTANSDLGNWLLSPLAVEIHQNVGAGNALLILGHRILRITYLYNELSTANLLHRHYDFKIHQKVYQKRFQFLVAYERNLQRTNELVKWVVVSLSAGLRHQLVQGTGRGSPVDKACFDDFNDTS